MLLSNNDIEIIEKKGYTRNYFVKSKKGWLRLKNKEGRCVFQNGKKCIIYEYRPEGCMLYPLIFNRKNKCAVVDQECPYEYCFRFNKKSVNQLFRLVTRIISERNDRRKSFN